MSLEDQVLFLFCGFGALNGIVIAGYFATRKPFSAGNAFLAGGLLALSLRVFKSAIFYFNPEVSLKFLQLGLTACALIGPLFYVYALSVVGKLERQFVPWRVHLSAVVLGVVSVGLIFPYHLYPEVWRGVIYKVYMYGWLGYQLLAMAVLLPLWRQALRARHSLTRDQVLALSVVSGTLIISLAYVFSRYTSYILATTSMSVLLFLSLLVFALFRTEKPKYGGRTIDEAASVVAQLNTLMIETKLFTNPDLTLASVAKRLNQPKAVLSQVLNETMGITFTTYLNQLRVEEAKETLSSSPDMPVEELVAVSGFNSQSTLYAAFKRFAGTTPGEVRKQLKSAS